VLSQSKDPYDPFAYKAGRSFYLLSEKFANEGKDYVVPTSHNSDDYYLFIQSGGVKTGKFVRHWWRYKINGSTRSISIQIKDKNIAQIAPKVSCKDYQNKDIHKKYLDKGQKVESS